MEVLVLAYRKLLRPQVADLRALPGNAVIPEPQPEPEQEPASYRDLQQQAKAAGIPANQPREVLEAELGHE